MWLTDTERIELYEEHLRTLNYDDLIEEFEARMDCKILHYFACSNPSIDTIINTLVDDYGIELLEKSLK